MDTRLELCKEFKDKVLKSFRSSGKMSWDKHEVQVRVMELWTEFLEGELERKDKFIVPRYDSTTMIGLEPSTSNEETTGG